jgi:hypothetical protein
MLDAIGEATENRKVPVCQTLRLILEKSLKSASERAVKPTTGSRRFRKLFAVDVEHLRTDLSWG